jgi:hypothetical protein
MNSNQIKTYDDLCEEKKRLEGLLALHKENVSANWTALKQELNPVNNVVSFFGKLVKRDKTNPLLNIGIDVAGDLVLRKFLLAKTGWATRLVVPLLLKNYSSNVIADKGKAFVQRLRNWLHRDTNGQQAPAMNNQDPPSQQ